MIVAIAAASDGFNPFASRLSLHYETIEGELHIQDGRMFVRQFELEGPIRVYASGSLAFGDAPHELDGVVGVFLFQRSRALLGKVPLVSLVVPGSDKGMVGAYFALDGSLEEPDVSTMKMKSLQEQLPDIITKPFELFHSLLSSDDELSDDDPTRFFENDAEPESTAGEAARERL